MQVLAKKMTVLYKLASGQLSKQSHYDFGLRALKAVLVMAGELKRGSPDLSEVSINTVIWESGVCLAFCRFYIENLQYWPELLETTATAQIWHLSLTFFFSSAWQKPLPPLPTLRVWCVWYSVKSRKFRPLHVMLSVWFINSWSIVHFRPLPAIAICC